MLKFAPDFDPTTPEILTAIDDYVPTVRGYEAMFDEVVQTQALADTVRGAFLATKLDGSNRLIAGQATSLQEYVDGAWVSRGTYTTSTEKWRFAQFGDATLAVRPDLAIQQSTSTSFSAISGAPKAKVIAVCQGFVMVCNYDDGVDQLSDGWFCSGIYDHTQWTPSVATQCANGRLMDTPGDITAIHRLGDDLIIFKRDSCYHARYVGPPVIWEIRLISPDIGCSSPDGVTNVGGTALIWASETDLWMYNGMGVPTSIGDGVREFWRTDSFPTYRNLSIARHDPANYRAFIWYVSGAGIVDKKPDKYLCYNYRSGLWGGGTKIVDDVVRYQSDLTYDDMGQILSIYDNVPPETYGSDLWAEAKKEAMVVVNPDHIVATLTGTPLTCSFTTGDMGETDQFTLLRRVTPKLLVTPDSAELTYYGKQHLDDAQVANGTVTLDSRKRFDLLKSARWHRIKFQTTGECEISGFKADLVNQGVE
jgi:hypothetical protein